MSKITLPNFAVPGTIVKILEKIKIAATPDNFNGDFLANTLGFKGGNYKTFIPWSKKIGLVNDDGTPTPLYKKFRNPATSAISLGEGLRKGYADLFFRDENVYRLDKPKFKQLVMDATGHPHDSKTLENIVNTFWNVKSIADFEINNESQTDENPVSSNESPIIPTTDTPKKRVSLGLNYTINLVLPKTDDPSIYNAIFKSLKDNLLND